MDIDLKTQPSHVLEAIDFIKQVIQDYTLENCSISFNGGKDCTVLLHLCRLAILSLGLDWSQFSVIYFSSREFPEIEEFIQSTAKQYNFNINRLGGSFREGLEHLLATTPIKAIFMGQRRVDPAGSRLQLISPSDPGWPAVDRINPILEWDHDQVWNFLRDNNLPYCSLYDKGYTSLGSPNTTKPNPLLLKPESEGGGYYPAYHLKDGNQERAGRVASTWNNKPKTTDSTTAHSTTTTASPKEDTKQVQSDL